MKKKPFKNIFISSIYQNAGKTTVSLGLYKAFREMKLKTAFMKPIGQEVVKIGESNIDKDSYLMGEIFRTGKKFKEMSPVTIGRGYTEKYILNPHKEKLKIAIEKAFKSLSLRKNAIIVEGTGHAGVGSVIDFSNADVAYLLGSKVVIVCEGGIGKSIDEIMLNKALFDIKGVEILGVVANKVLPEKYDKIKRILGKGLAQKKVKLLGVIPFEPLLKAPTIEQVKRNLNFQLLCGHKGIARRVLNTIVAAMEPHHMIQYLKDGTLVLISGDRVDNILAAVSSHLISKDGKGFRIAGVILTGGLIPTPKILDLLKKSQMPVLITDADTYTVAASIEHLICKIQKTDKDKIQKATRLVKRHVDIKAILDRA